MEANTFVLLLLVYAVCVIGMIFSRYRHEILFIRHSARIYMIVNRRTISCKFSDGPFGLPRFERVGKCPVFISF